MSKIFLQRAVTTWGLHQNSREGDFSYNTVLDRTNFDHIFKAIFCKLYKILIICKIKIPMIYIT